MRNETISATLNFLWNEKLFNFCKIDPRNCVHFSSIKFRFCKFQCFLRRLSTIPHLPPFPNSSLYITWKLNQGIIWRKFFVIFSQWRNETKFVLWVCCSVKLEEAIWDRRWGKTAEKIEFISTKTLSILELLKSLEIETSQGEK